MFHSCHSRLFATAFGLFATAVPCTGENVSRGELETTVAELKQQNRNLQMALVESNRAEKTSREQLEEVSLRLEAL
jgi:hypothetical protein